MARSRQAAYPNGCLLLSLAGRRTPVSRHSAAMEIIDPSPFTSGSFWYLSSQYFFEAKFPTLTSSGPHRPTNHARDLCHAHGCIRVASFAIGYSSVHRWSRPCTHPFLVMRFPSLAFPRRHELTLRCRIYTRHSRRFRCHTNAVQSSGPDLPRLPLGTRLPSALI